MKPWLMARKGDTGPMHLVNELGVRRDGLFDVSTLCSLQLVNVALVSTSQLRFTSILEPHDWTQERACKHCLRRFERRVALMREVLDDARQVEAPK